MEFGPVEPKTSGGIPHLCRVANGGQKARAERGWVMDVPVLVGDANVSRFEDNHSLHGHALPDHCEFHRQLTNL